MKTNLIKKKNGVELIQLASGYQVRHSNSEYGFGTFYTDNKKTAMNFFNKVSSDTLSKNISIKENKPNNKNFRIKIWR